jgi:glycosyltransferase involved in cell wall biosynthesis
MNLSYPNISCIVIGINSARTIVSCIKSIKKSDYPKLIEIIYVDGGSSDNSVELAKKLGVKVIQLKQEHPTPGRGRNVGWKNASNELIQFLDGDTTLDQKWLKKAIKHIDNKTVAVCGYGKEKDPNKNWYHLVADLEWSNETGNIKYFGGNVLIKKSILEETSGYNDNLIAGEDPEFSFRIREKGYNIKRLDSLMYYHDINMNNLKEYFKRCFRKGYGYAEVGTMRLKKKEYGWIKRTIKTTIKTIGTFVFLILALLFQNIYFVSFALLLNIIPIIKISRFKKQYKLNIKKSIIYALHLVLAAYLTTAGVFRYYIGKLFNKPLTNKSLLK